MSGLSLESMSTSAGSQSRRREDSSAETAYESDIDTSIDFDETTGIASFSSGTRYSIHELDRGTKDAVIKALSTPSKLTLRGCSPRGQGYVFLISETIDYHVRAPYGIGPYDGPSCSCRQDERNTGLQHPCRHTLWVCDQILSQLVPLPRDPYTWRIDGYTTKHGNVCDFVSDFHLDVLADSLHCDVMTGEPIKPRSRRIQTVREILATFSGNPVEQYRPDLTGETMGKRVVKEDDLEETIFRMLLENDAIFSYFLASMRKCGALNPRFRGFRDRADTALDAFDSYIKASDLERAQLSKNPQWCYKTFKDILEQIKAIILNLEIDRLDYRAAANTLVYILDQIVRRNEDHDAIRDGNDDDNPGEAQFKGGRKINIFNELVVQSRHNFILDVLDELSVEFIDHLLPDLRRIEQSITNTNIPLAYLHKLRDIMSRLRVPSPRSGSEPTEGSRKRTSQGDDRHAKRVK
ncbi:hypothetical protein ONZ43_g7073 [Nemania bipapillata]|uniref:Uncharacterized protein n=1 Tax=Nemania bipapillata TaxID=110536 RepID=A0ACC2HU49_9PEZI|nr:hypothetical protein ONZ43_g7073 [Nemania bipapillata]